MSELKGMYKSKDLHFGKMEKWDSDVFWNLKQDSWMQTHQKTIINHADQDAWFESMEASNSPHNLVLAVRRSDEMSGYLGHLVGCYKIFNADYISRSADVGWDLLEPFRGKGLGKAIVAGGANFCFDILNLRRLNAEILETNIPSQKCATAAGFILEGTKREAVHKPDGFVGSQVWGLLASERVD